MSLRRHLAFVLLLLAAASCTIQRPLQIPAATDHTPAPRRPDGVAIDLEASLPAPVSRASTEDGLVALREPVSQDGAIEVVREFLHAVAHTDLPAVRRLLTSDATAAPIGTPAGPPAEAHWDRRLHKIDYKSLGTTPLYRESAIEIYRHGDLDHEVGDRPARPSIMGLGDVLVRVPMATTRIGADRVFGDEMLFVLRRVEHAFLIQAVFEDFQVP